MSNIFFPPQEMVPCCTFKRPIRMSMAVVFPAPEGPITPTLFPMGMRILASSSTFFVELG